MVTTLQPSSLASGSSGSPVMPSPPNDASAMRSPGGTPSSARTSPAARAECRATNGRSTMGERQSSNPPHIGNRSVSVA